MSIGAEISYVLQLVKEKLLCGFRYAANSNRVSYSYLSFEIYSAILNRDVRYEWQDRI